MPCDVDAWSRSKPFGAGDGTRGHDFRAENTIEAWMTPFGQVQVPP